ncbi:MAG: hypothetical protein MUO39_12980 [Steroidobacteraceae bacterium]|nr:hypothetical protein [Steroidobacteraceae bacterium]
MTDLVAQRLKADTIWLQLAAQRAPVHRQFGRHLVHRGAAAQHLSQVGAEIAQQGL